VKIFKHLKKNVFITNFQIDVNFIIYYSFIFIMYKNEFNNISLCLGTYILYKTNNFFNEISSQDFEQICMRFVKNDKIYNIRLSKYTIGT